MCSICTASSHATCPTWEAFLHRAMRGDADMLLFLQRLVGYCLTGLVKEKMQPILYGPKDTGKTTFVETLMTLFGEDYAAQVGESTIARTSRESEASNDVARLRGSRLAVVSETSQDMRINEARIKAWSGGNKVVVWKARV